MLQEATQAAELTAEPNEVGSRDVYMAAETSDHLKSCQIEDIHFTFWKFPFL